MKGRAFLNKLIFAAISGAVFLAVIVISFALRYGHMIDFKLLVYYLVIAAAAMAAILLGQRIFGVAMLIGAAAGFLADIVISSLRAGTPNMASGMVNLVIVIVSVVAGIVIQLVHNIRAKDAL